MKLKNIRLHDSFKLADGEAHVFLLHNAKGIEVKITNYGGIIMSVMCPDRNGTLENIVLGYDHVNDYCTDKYRTENPYFGAIVGRHAGIISNSKFSIDNVDYELKRNFGSHNLHGGEKGFDKVLWQNEIVDLDGMPALKLGYVSDDGEEGFPGKLTASVTYQLTDTNDLKILYAAQPEKKTIINLTNHSYFNLSGGTREDILTHELFINASRYLELDRDLVPTGAIKHVGNTPLDFRSPMPVGKRIEADFDQLFYAAGYDVTFVVDKQGTQLLTLAAAVHHPSSGRYLEVFTTQPALHLYTANVLSNAINPHYRPRLAICLEAQYYPDAPNHPAFPSNVFDVGEVYLHTTVYRFSMK